MNVTVYTIFGKRRTSMKIRLICVLGVLMCAVTSGHTADVGSKFTEDEVSIYRDFLLHYPEQLSNMIGMQNTTVAFDPFDPLAGSHSKPTAFRLMVPLYASRKLPPEVMVLTTEQAVRARIASKGKLVNPRNRDPKRGPDGYVRTRLTLSEIAFDARHEHAAFLYSAACDCLGGQGGTVVYQRLNGHWKVESIAQYVG